MLNLPKNEWICEDCNQEWFEEFGKNEIKKCIICGSKKIKENKVDKKSK